MSCSRLATLLLCVLLPLQGFAQDPTAPPLVPAPTQSEEEPTQPEAAHSEEEGTVAGHEDTEPQGEIIRRDRLASEALSEKVPRILVESLSGAALGVVGAAPGGLLFLALAVCDDCGTQDSTLVLAFGLGVAGLIGGTALGVTVGGNLMGGEGRFLPTLAGAALGMVAGALAAFPAGAVIDGGWMIPAITLPVTGAIIGYELSHSAKRKRRAAMMGMHVEVVPVVSVKPSGGLVAGLAGRF